MSIEQLNSSYREGGWTIRQVVHHTADCYINYYIRIKFALTEDTPIIKHFKQELWAELTDAKTLAVEISLELIESLNMRLLTLTRSLSPDELNRKFSHPVTGYFTIIKAIGFNVWHSYHHLAHILNYRKSIGFEG